MKFSDEPYELFFGARCMALRDGNGIFPYEAVGERALTRACCMTEDVKGSVGDDLGGDLRKLDVLDAESAGDFGGGVAAVHLKAIPHRSPWAYSPRWTVRGGSQAACRAGSRYRTKDPNQNWAAYPVISWKGASQGGLGRGG